MDSEIETIDWGLLIKRIVTITYLTFVFGLMISGRIQFINQTVKPILDYVSRRQIVAKESIEKAPVEEKKSEVGCPYFDDCKKYFAM